MKRVLVTEPIHDAGLSLLHARDDVEVIELADADPDTLVEAVAGVHGIAVRSAYLTPEILSNANALEVVSRHGVGCDRVAVDYLSSRNIPVAIANGANTQSVAEHTLALLLSLARDLPAQHAVMRDMDWGRRDRFRAKDLYGATVLIIGYGRIGRRVAPLFKAFGMDVVVADIALDAELAASMGCRGVEDFRPELANADYISLHVPLDESTRNLISGAEFAQMKPGAILINCARGGIVDEDALVEALEKGALAGAGIDVFDDEPPVTRHPLFDRDDVMLTPHNAAASNLSVQEMARMCAQNVLDAFDGCLREDCTFNHDALKNGR